MDQELARKLWKYDNGKLYWREKRKNRILLKPAGNTDKRGYSHVSYKSKWYRRSRIIWLMFKGYWTKNQIDHINRIKGDDRIENLREVTNALNQRNQPVRNMCLSKIKYIHQANNKTKYKTYKYWIFQIQGTENKKKILIAHKRFPRTKKGIQQAILFKKDWFKNNSNLIKKYQLYSD